jgi:glycosyltransferase involved in cell wall biosynthesis
MTVTSTKRLPPKISVVMPVYDGAEFLEETLKSLSYQDFKDFEVLCIDDCSTDHSSQILQKYAEEDSRFKYLSTHKNLGIVPKVMNYAASFAIGQYFVYSSQDDLFSEDWLGTLYKRAQDTNADAVLPDVEFFYADHNEKRRISGLNGDRSVIMSGRDAFVASLSWQISGNAMWRINFLKEIGFHDFGMFADEYTIRTFFLNCADVAFCEGVFFYRQDNPNAITKKVSSKLLDAAHNDFKIWELAQQNKFDQDVCGPLAYKALKSLVKNQALIFRRPQLKDHAYKCATDFEALQSNAFEASLTGFLHSSKRLPMRLIYLSAYRSKMCLLFLARIKAMLF